VLDRFIPGVANGDPFLVIPLPFLPLTFSRHTLMAIVLVWLFAFVHIRGVGPGRVVMNVLATLKVTTLLVFIALGFSIGSGSGANFQQAAAGSVSATNWLLALVPVMFTYSGWNAASYMAEEIRDPRSQCTSFPAARHHLGHRHLRAAERAVSLRDAGDRARRP
jgi:APA family basic amino acid/polyamine antiporter